MSAWLRNFSIGNRIIAIVTGINLVIVLSIGVIAVSSNRRTLEAQATRSFAQKNSQAADNILNQLSKVVDTTTQLQVALTDRDNFSQSRLRNEFKEIITADEDVLIHRISVYVPAVETNSETTDDSVIVFQIQEPRTNVINETRTYSFDNQQPDPDEPMFDVLTTKQPLWFEQDIAYSDSEHLGAISLAIPYEYNDDVTSVFWVDVPITDFDAMIKSEMSGVGLLSDTINGYALLLDHNNNLINRQGDNSLDLTPEIVVDMLAQIANASTVDNLKLIQNSNTEQELLAAVDLLSLNKWQLVSILPRSDIPGSSEILIFQLVLISTLGIVIIVMSINYFTRSAIVHPLQNLSQVAQEIGSGDLRYYIDYRDNDDEIGYLARALEGMKGNIAHSYEELRNWSRTLEVRVEERTRELNETREEAEVTANELRAVYDESLVVVNEPTLEPILRAFTHRILSLMEASYCSVWLMDDEGEHLHLIMSTEEEEPTDFFITIDQGLVGACVRQQSLLIVDDYTSYQHRITLARQQTNVYVRAMSVPLMFDGQPMGAAFVGRTADGLPFDEADSRLMTLFANLVSPAVRNAQLYNQREIARREAERANRVKTRFLASVTHELRTPLNLVINNMDFMRIGAFGEVNEEQISRLNQTVRSAEHLLYLINDLLDVSKIEAGEMQMFIQPNDVQTLIEDVVDSAYAFMERIDDKTDKIKIVLDIEEDLPKIPMDARRIRQVIMNLMSNAIKFTHEGEVNLTVKTIDDGIYFAVHDTGIGIPKEELNKLFEAFERTTQAKEQNIEGTGLGLPISQYLVYQHGGKLDVQSVPGEGTTFMFTLPFETPEVDDSTIARRDLIMPMLKSDE